MGRVVEILVNCNTHLVSDLHWSDYFASILVTQTMEEQVAFSFPLQL